jgi:arylsulfatase
MKKMISWKTFTAAFVAVLALCLACPAAFAVKDKPNILLILSDDVGITNISAYSDGLVGYRTPNIDRIANEGMRFTDYYAEQSCTAGRSAFITGQSPVRTGLTKVGMPGADIGLRLAPISGSGPRTRRSPNCSSRTAT